MMHTNVVAGDIAVVVKDHKGANEGKIVHVMHRIVSEPYADALHYILDGRTYKARPDDGIVWVVESLGEPFDLLVSDGSHLLLQRAPCRDRDLRPLRYSDETDEAVLRARSRGDYIVTTYTGGPKPKTETEIIQNVLERARRLGW